MNREREAGIRLYFINCSDDITIAVRPLRVVELAEAPASGWTTVSVLTNSGCPEEGDQTEGQEQVGAPSEMTRQQETSKTKVPSFFTLYTFPVGGGEFRELHRRIRGQEYRRGVDDNLLCFISAKKRFLLEKSRLPASLRRLSSNGI
jgi:hypothetical protein